MKFSSQEEYGLRCLLQIARRGDEGTSVSISEISREEGLSEAYVGKLMRILRLAGFVESVRGQEGGYTLTRPANGIFISDVLSVLGGRIYDPDFCGHFSGSVDECLHTSQCSLKPLWHKVQSAIDEALADLTLTDLIAHQQLVQIETSTVNA